MPHVILKLFPGRSDRVKEHLVEKIVKDVVDLAKCEEKSVSVAFEEVAPQAWAEKVYQPDIIGCRELLYVKPGYTPIE